MCKGANLSGVDLSGRDLSGYDLSNANLSDANLSKTVLKGANLTGVDLSGRDLIGYDLSNVNLSNANLSKTVPLGANPHTWSQLATTYAKIAASRMARKTEMSISVQDWLDSAYAEGARTEADIKGMLNKLESL